MHLLDQPDRWRRVDALFTELLDLGPLAREERLATLAAEDPSLRRDLEALLRLDAEESGLLDRSAALLAANLLATDAELAAAAARIPTPPEEQLSGRRLAHFLVGEPLGAGGMGVVYRAFDESLHRTVALKFLTLRASRERLLKEARAASALSHPGIVVIHEVGSAEGLDFIAMELVDGTTLQRRIPQQGLPVELAVDYAIQVADALARAHAHGIIHRDLKPGNLIVTPEGRVKVLDFGLAKATAVPALSDRTSALTLPGSSLTGGLAGTPEYMAPEHLEGRPVDARSDIFSLGCLLYEMLAGENPFLKDNLAETAVAVVTEQAPSLGRRRPGLPRALVAIVERALRKEPARRYQSAAEMIADLRPLIAAGETRRRRLRGALAVAAVALVIVAAIAWLRARGPAAPPPSAAWIATFADARREPALAPDGRRLAFVDDDRAGVPQVWLDRRDGRPAQQLTSDPRGAHAPRWSGPQTLVYEVRDGGTWELPIGGAPRPLSPR